MNEEARQSAIARLEASIDAHLIAIQHDREQIRLLKKQQGQDKKPTGIGAVACARRVAGQMKKTA